MNIWENYLSRLDVAGDTRRDTVLIRAIRNMTDKFQNSLSYNAVCINGVSQNVMIVNSDNMNEKNIYSMPGEDILHGGIVEWMDNYWLITDKDASNELYSRAKMIQCNYLLKWVDQNACIHEQWCVVEDGTKYLTGVYEDRNFIVERGDSRLALIISKNENTSILHRGQRFLIDDGASNNVLAYELTKPLKVVGVFNGNGVFKFVLQEVNTTDNDSQELCIADYYKYYTKNGELRKDPDNSGSIDDGGKKVWL